MPQGKKRKLETATPGPVAKLNTTPIPKLFSYESLKTVLEHLEANKRLDLARRCDSIQTADKAAPLKIENLKFGSMMTIINNRTYQLGVYRKFHQMGDDRFYSLVRDNSGGTPYDLDRFGFREISEEIMTTPGDVKLFFKQLPGKPTLEESRRRIEYCRGRLFYLRRCSIRDKSTIKEMRNEILSSSCYVDGRTPPYNNYILFTMRTKESQHSESKKEYMEYNKSLQEASKHLNTQMFGGRCSIQVKKMKLWSGETTIRLPPDVKIHVQIIDIDSYLSRTIENLVQILTNSSFPLKTIETTCTNNTEDLTHQHILEAKKFVVLEEVSSSYLRNVTNWSLFPSRTHFVDCPDYLSIIKRWQANEPAVGTSFSVSFSTWGKTRQGISDLVGGVIRKGIIVVALGETRNIEVTYGKVDKKKYDSYGATHFLYMKVVDK